MAEAITLKGIANYGNTIDVCNRKSDKKDVAFGTTSTSLVKSDSEVSVNTATSKDELQTTLTSVGLSDQRFKRNRYTYLVVIFAVSTCIASSVCASIVLFVVFNPGGTVRIQPEDTRPTSMLNELPTDKNSLRCLNSTVLRMRAMDKLSTFHDDRVVKGNEFQRVCCINIPPGNCSGVLPYKKTFIPNEHVDSFKTAERYLEEIDGPLDCDTHALYVVCSWLYPPCISVGFQVEPCKAICEGVVDGCQETFSNTSIGSSISCDHSPVGETNEMICQSCLYSIDMHVGEVYHFTSRNYPLAFPPNTYCVWLLTSPSSTRIKINITNVDVVGNLGQYLQIRFGQATYSGRPINRAVMHDVAFVAPLNTASVISRSDNMINESRGFTAKVTAIDKEDALSCGYTFTSLNEEDICDGKENCDGARDENMCRTECGYSVLLVNENSVEVIASTNNSIAFEECIYRFTCPSRTKLRLEFLSLKGVVTGCNFKIGTGTNPFNASTELTVPQISIGLDFPGNNGWIWFAQSLENSSFVLRLSSFTETKVISMAANDSYIIDALDNATSTNNWLEYGSLVFKSPSGYHFKLTFTGLNDIHNNIVLAIVGLGSDPLKYHVFLLKSDYDNELELYTDAIWLEYGHESLDIGAMVSTVPARTDSRRHIRVDEVATITFTSSEIDGVDEGSNVVTTVWIVTSIRHPKVAVKILNFSCETSTFNFITIGHGLNPEISSSILFRVLASDFRRKLLDDVIIQYSTFWVQHTSYRRINDTRFSLELRGISNTDDLICPPKLDVTEGDFCDDEFDCPDLRDEMDCVDSDISCGERPLHPGTRTKRVIGGSEPLPGSWPWQGLIFSENKLLCGCTLIDELWAISASHCFSQVFSRFNDISVMFGSTTLQNFSANHLIVPVSLVFLHPEDIISDLFDHDFVLMKLSRPVPFTNYIRPACISNSYNQFTEDDVCYVTGFGVQGTGKPTVVMHQAPVNIFSNEKCKEFQGSIFKITENQICAGRREGGIDTCQGDSGGPLVCLETDEKWYLVGATSYGEGCARRFRPGVYTRVSQYLTFINKILNADSEI